MTTLITELPVATTRTKRDIKLPKPATMLALVYLGGLAFMAVFADYLPFIRHYTQTVRVDGVAASNFALGPGEVAWFGTDQAGKDVFAKCIYGARVTLTVGVVATFVGLVVGGTLGVMAGYFKGRTDKVISFITEVLLALPALIIAIVLVFRFDDLKSQYSWLAWMDRIWQITAVLSLLSIAPLARIVRAQTLSLSEREFVLAARSLGAKGNRVIMREILPNLVPAMMAVAFTGLGILIAAEGALAFLGYSVETPTPTWGKMISVSYNRIDDAWWASLMPAFLLFLTVLSFNVIGDRVARRFDIREATL
jgi:peptide/nickel transport system permease protein